MSGYQFSNKNIYPAYKPPTIIINCGKSLAILHSSFVIAIFLTIIDSRNEDIKINNPSKLDTPMFY